MTVASNYVGPELVRLVQLEQPEPVLVDDEAKVAGPGLPRLRSNFETRVVRNASNYCRCMATPPFYT